MENYGYRYHGGYASKDDGLNRKERRKLNAGKKKYNRRGYGKGKKIKRS